MSDPITAATIVGLAVKFLEGAASKGGAAVGEDLWKALKNRFAGRKKAEETLAALEAAEGKAPEQVQRLTSYVDVEMDDEVFAAQVRQMAQQILNQSQTQMQQSNINKGRDQFVINQPTGDLKLGGS